LYATHDAHSFFFHTIFFLPLAFNITATMKLLSIRATVLLLCTSKVFADSEETSLCVTGKGDFIFRGVVEAQFSVQACLQDADTGVASGNLFSGSSDDGMFVFHVHCMHLDGNDGVYIGAEIQALNEHEKHLQEMDEGKQARKLNKKAKKGKKGEFCPIGRELLVHKDLYTEEGERRLLVAADGKIDTETESQGTLALFYLKMKDTDDKPSAIGVKLHHNFSTKCVDFGSLVKDTPFSSEDVDTLTTGYIQIE
jgi:hypothetical protein